MLSVFDQYGNVAAAAVTDEAIEALPELQRARLTELISADLAAREGQARLAAARKDENEKRAAHDKAHDEHNALNRPVTHQQALLDAIEANRTGKSPTPKGNAAVTAARKAVDDLTKKLATADEKAQPPIKAQLHQAKVALASLEKPARAKEALRVAVEALVLAQAELTRATADARRLDLAKGSAVLAWMNAQTDKPTDLDIRRAAAKADAERRRAEMPEPPPGRKIWPLETVMAARGAMKHQTRTNFRPRG
jgi:hypothetical protein